MADTADRVRDEAQGEGVGSGQDGEGHSRSGLLPEQIRRQVLLFMAVTFLLGVSGGIFEPTFNNYLKDTFHLTAAQRGSLEFPREFPGFMTAVLFGWLFFLVESRMAVVAVLAAALGVLGLAFCREAAQWYPMIACILLLNAGTHLMMPLQSAIGLGLAEQGQQATILGRIGSVGTAGAVAGAGIIWLSGALLHLPYKTVFLISAGSYVTAASILNLMHAKPRPRKRASFIFRREYRLFYILSILFGARKQVFITFGAWVLVNVYRQQPDAFAKLLIASAFIGMFLKPALGRWIDRFGERPVLFADAALMVLVCLGYGFAERLGLGQHAITLVFGCYMMDQILFATGMARATYLDKIAVRSDDVSPTLSLGVSIDHAVSMTVPLLGGWVWKHWGYPYVFVGAAVLAMLNGFAALQIRTPEKA